MRYFLTGRLKTEAILAGGKRHPRTTQGRRPAADLGRFRQHQSGDLPFLAPKGFEAHNTRVYRVGDYRGRPRARLVSEPAAIVTARWA